MRAKMALFTPRERKENEFCVTICVFFADMQEFLASWVKVGCSGRTRPWPFWESMSTPWMRKGG
jgi:hypothetical protein